MFAINNEIMKLKIYSEHKNISINKELIDFLVYDQFDINAFDILDNMITDKNKTLKILNDMQNK
jgi:DNA polymerase III delta subunit